MEQYFNLINWDSAIDIIKALAAIGVGGGIMSLITSALVGANWPSPAKALVAFILCIVGSLIPIAVAGVDMTNLVIVLPLLWLGSQAFYRLWFKPMGIAPWMETLVFNTLEERLSCFDRANWLGTGGSSPGSRAALLTVAALGRDPRITSGVAPIHELVRTKQACRAD